MNRRLYNNVFFPVPLQVDYEYREVLYVTFDYTVSGMTERLPVFLLVVLPAVEMYDTAYRVRRDLGYTRFGVAFNPLECLNWVSYLSDRVVYASPGNYTELGEFLDSLPQRISRSLIQRTYIRPGTTDLSEILDDAIRR